MARRVLAVAAFEHCLYDCEDADSADYKTCVFLSSEKLSCVNVRAEGISHILELATPKSKFQERIRRGPSVSFRVRRLSHECVAVKRCFNQCISGCGEAMEFQVFCDFRSRLTSIIDQKWKQRIRRGLPFPWRDDFAPSPLNQMTVWLWRSRFPEICKF